MRAKNAANSPYAIALTDARDFSDTDGEVLGGAEHIAYGDDLAALANHIAALYASGANGIASGSFAIPPGQLAHDGTKAGYANGLLEWFQVGALVFANVKIVLGGTGNTTIGVDTAWLIAQGLPTPKSLTLSPASDYPRAIPVSANFTGSGNETPASAVFDPDDLGYLQFTRASSANIQEIYGTFVYQAASGTTNALYTIHTIDGNISTKKNFVRGGTDFTMVAPFYVGESRVITNNSDVSITLSAGENIGNELNPVDSSFTIYAGESYEFTFDGDYWRIS